MSKTSKQTAPVKKQKGQMGRWARYYDLLMVLFTLGKEKRLRQLTLDTAQVKPGNKVLEIGCGTGTLTLAAKMRVGLSGEVEGIDIAPEMIAVASRKAARKGIDISFRVGSIEEIPFSDHRFDVVMCSFMIFHMPDEIRRKGFKEIYRVLKSGGHLFIIDGVDLFKLETVLKDFSFSEFEMHKAKFSFIRIWTLKATVRKD
jgi:ubiquinone/menaquinone biosynthesis C-methylase UbiE